MTRQTILMKNAPHAGATIFGNQMITGRFVADVTLGLKK